MLTQKLSEFVINTKTDAVPWEVLDGARDAFIDAIGCALAGSLEEPGEVVVRFLRSQGGNAEATVWGAGL
ncbi:MAG: MmgE/PrpD family protein, partial [bacterium]